MSATAEIDSRAFDTWDADETLYTCATRRGCVASDPPSAPRPRPTTAPTRRPQATQQPQARQVAAPQPQPVEEEPPPPPPPTTEEVTTHAWTNAPFAKPQVNIQPVGNVTLTGLPTYFQATFGEGLAPGETVTTELLGHQVEIRPTRVTYTYYFGDGSKAGPTTDVGGPYPTGNIKHTYTKKGSVTTRIDATYYGQFRIDGQGDWTTIPSSATVTGPTQTLQVRIMQSRLSQ